MQIPEPIRTPEEILASVNRGVIDVVEEQIDLLYAEYENVD